jgi:parallel beta-helix repeat protein
VLVDKSLTILGGQTRLSGETGPTTVRQPNASGAFTLLADSVTINSFTITPQPATTTGAEGIVTSPLYSGAQILGNTFSGDTLGIYLNSSGVLPTLVRDNKFISNDLAGPASGNAIFSDLGLKNTTISYNSFTGHSNSAVNLYGGDGSTASATTHSNVQILNNTLSGDSPIIAVNMTNSKVNNNTITNPIHGDGIWFVGAVTNTEVASNKLTGNAGSESGIALVISDLQSGGFFPVAHDAGGHAIANSNNKITSNTVSGWSHDGIRLQSGSQGNTVSWNVANGNGTGVDPTVGDGIALEGASSNTLMGNTTNHNRRNGVYLFNAQWNVVNFGTANENGGDGLLMENGSLNNTVNYNTFNKNVNGIQLIGSSNNKILNNTVISNKNVGILVEAASVANTLKWNTARLNAVWDLKDTTSGGGTAGTANTWQFNYAPLRSPYGLH